MPPSPFALVSGTPFAAYTASAAPLAGGLVNHVWRLAAPGDPPRTVVVKCAEPVLAAFPSMPFSTERMAFEARGLALLGGGVFGSGPGEAPGSSGPGSGPGSVPGEAPGGIPGEAPGSDPGSVPGKALGSAPGNGPAQDDGVARAAALGDALGSALRATPGVRVPRLLHYDAAVPFLVLEDAGPQPDLLRWCIERAAAGRHAELACGLRSACGRIGAWLARLHGLGHDRRAELEPLFTNEPARALVGSAVYDAVCAHLAERSQLADRHRVAARVRRHRAETARGGPAPATLVFGDLWTGSVLLDAGARQVTLLDLEFADYAPVSADLAHLGTHLLLAHFACAPDYRPGADPCPPHVAALLAAYRQTLATEHPAAFRALVADGAAARLCAEALGIGVVHEVLTSNRCRCAGVPPAAAAVLTSSTTPLGCPCARALLDFARGCIYGDTSPFALLA